MKDFNLSEKIVKVVGGDGYGLFTEDVKIFIQKLKAHFTPEDKQWVSVEMFSPREFVDFIDTLAGEELSK